jgi:multidrug efflux pump subunit AcrA (membrane-fusion protein)
MRPGMRFRGQVETDRVADALVVDADAVFLKAEGPVVYRKTWLGHEKVPVELGRRNDKRVEVLSGLTEADMISAVDLDRERAES